MDRRWTSPTTTSWPFVSNMGAPLVGQERLTDPRTIERAVRMMEEYLDRRLPP